MKAKIELPPNWTVKHDTYVGYNFYYKDKLILQHPDDNDGIRKIIHSINAHYTEESI